MRSPGRPFCPRAKSFFGLPLGYYEVARIAFDRAQQLESKEPGRLLDGAGARGKPLLEFCARAFWNINSVDLHDCHGRDRTRVVSGSVQHVAGLDDHGGAGIPIILLHGLMGRGSTWRRHVPWLREYGRVFTYDARFHRGRADDDPADVDESELTTEAFVADVAHVLRNIGEPAVLVGHSMGSLHAWCVAAEYPELVRALVVEDMSPDFRGRTTQPWDSWFDSWPVEFADPREVYELFGQAAGQYFLDSFDRTESGWRLHGHIALWRAIAAHWGTRDYWAQWRVTRTPALLLEGEYSVTPPGQMRAMADTQRGAPSYYLKVDGAAHLIHDEAPHVYRGAVEAFLAGLPQ